AARAMFYGSYATGRSTWSAGGSIARASYDVRRGLAFAALLPAALGGGAWLGGVDREATAEVTGLSLDAWADWNHTIHAGSWTVRPGAGLRAARFGRDAFVERGAESLSLEGQEQSNATM